METSTARPLLPGAGWRAWLAVGAAWVLLVALTAAGLWHLRMESVREDQQELRFLALALADEIDRGVGGVEDGLKAIRSEIEQGLLGSAAPSRDTLRTRVELMPLVSVLWLLDSQGRPLGASGDPPAPAPGVFDAQFESLSRDRLAFSRPFPAAGAEQPLLAMALPFGNAPGATSGVIVAGVPAAALLGALSSAAPPRGLQLALLRRDGVRLVGTDAAPPSTEATQLLAAEQSVPRYALTVVVTRDLDQVLQTWWRISEAAVLALLLLLTVMAAATHFALLAARRRADAERARQSQLARASRLEAMGSLAGGVAHDFNNILAAILGYGEMARDEAPDGTDQARYLDNVLNAGLRGKSLVERILSFGRGGARASTVFALEAVVDEVLTMIATSLPAGVVLERVLDAPGGRLRGDPTRAFEAVMNLCTNAIQAMPEGGMLSVRLVRQHVADARVLSHSSLAPGEYLQLSVADEGVGIAPDVAEHLFEPFFTTRGAQSGTGLGLAVVHGVISEFGGAIDVRSTPGAGARFTLYLPESGEEIAAAPRVEASRKGRGERILVVDDQPELKALVEEMLQALGYQGVGYTDPVAALEAFGSDPHGYAAVVTDEAMPRLAGTGLAKAALALRPDLPILLVSGYGGAALAERAAAAGVTRVLAKPLRRADLAQALADALHP